MGTPVGSMECSEFDINIGTAGVDDDLAHLFLMEQAREPHWNPLVCSVCGRVYITSMLAGRKCTKMSRPCSGVICRAWTSERSHVELERLMRNGSIVVAQSTGEQPATPVGMAACEPFELDDVLTRLGFQRDVLGSLYSMAGRRSPCIAVVRLWLREEVDQARAALMLIRLVETAVDRAMLGAGVTLATVLVPVALPDSESRHSALKQMLAQGYRMLTRDNRQSRHRALLAFNVRRRD